MIDRLRELLRAAPDAGPWIRKWESLDVQGISGAGVLLDQRNIDLATAAVSALPELLDAHDRMAGALGEIEAVFVDLKANPKRSELSALHEIGGIVRAALAVPKEENPE